MRTPDLKECPVCLTPTTYEEEYGTECNVTARAVQCSQSTGSFSAATLTWMCNECGCTWQHGQFSGCGLMIRGADVVKRLAEELV